MQAFVTNVTEITEILVRVPATAPDILITLQQATL
jgi:hypothetical protein